MKESLGRRYLKKDVNLARGFLNEVIPELLRVNLLSKCQKHIGGTSSFARTR